MKKIKDSKIDWIGLIPKEWSIKPIRYLISNHFSGSWGDDAKGNNDTSDRICIRVADFDFHKMKLKENIDYTIRSYSSSEIHGKTLKYGDLLIEKSGGGEKTPVGRTVVYRLDDEALFANFIDCIRLDTNSYLFEFAKYVFYGLYTNGVTNLYYNQTTGIQNLSIKKYFREAKLPVPPIIEQQLIADFLDRECGRLDSILDNLREQIETLEKYKESLIYETVTCGLDKTVDFKSINLEWFNKIPKHWDVKKIKYISSISSGDAIDINDIFDDGLYPVYGGGELIGYTNDYNCMSKDILIGRVGSCGCLTYLTSNARATDNALILKSNCNSKYIYYILMASNIKNLSSTSAQPLLTATKVKNLKIPFTNNINEQTEISSFLDIKCREIDTILLNLLKQIGILEEYKKSVIYEYVTGKKRIERSDS